MSQRSGEVIPGRDEVERILVVELWNIGDVVLTIPFLFRLRTLFPKARTTLLSQSHGRTILEGTDLVDDFITADLAWIKKRGIASPFDYRLREFTRIIADLRRRRFDVAFQNRVHLRERGLLALSGARRRVGYAVGTGHEILTDAVRSTSDDQNRADSWLELLEPFGGAGEERSQPQIRVSSAARSWANEYLRNQGIMSGDVILGIHPGASIPQKRWPLQRFAEVAQTLASRDGVRVLSFVEPSDYGIELGYVAGVVSARVDLTQMMALLERCDLLVCNDSGPMHLAGALGIRTVAIFGSGLSRSFGPLGSGHQFISARDGASSEGHAPAYDVAAVPPAKVLEAIERALQEERETAAESRPHSEVR